MATPTAVRAGLFVVAFGLVYGQTDDKSLTFDAATIKPASVPALGGGDGKTITTKTGREKASGGPGTTDPDRIHFPNVTLKSLLTTAYDVKESQIVGPNWLDTERFAVEATMPQGTTKEQFQVMLQNLLTERFKMTIRRESRELPTWTLTVSKNGLRMNGSAPVTVKGAGGAPLSELQPIIKASVMMGPPPGSLRWTGWQASMGDLAKNLADELRVPVTDATGLEGKYNFTLNFSRVALNPQGTGGASAADGEPLPDIFAALQSVGLKLDKTKAPLPVIVIDHAEKKPSEN
jgi:uncharacterized protein (TIGR03435 family)